MSVLGNELTMPVLCMLVLRHGGVGYGGLIAGPVAPNTP